MWITANNVQSLNNCRFGDYLHFMFPMSLVPSSLVLILTFASKAIVEFPFTNSNIQLYQHMQFIFQIPVYLVLGTVSGAVMFWTERSCWRKGYSNKATLLLCWSHRYRISTVVITNWMIVMKCLCFQMAMDIPLSRRCFLPSITDKTFTRLDYE